MQRGIITAFVLAVLCVLAVAGEASEVDIEKEVQENLYKSRAIVDRVAVKIKSNEPVSSEIQQLKVLSENIQAAHLLLQERFRLREEAVQNLGTNAQDRHRVMEEGYLKALGDYLALIESLQQSALSSQLQTPQTQQTLQTLKTLLDKILPKKKRPIFGSLPYRNLNYPAREPDASPAIKPAYKGGNKTVNPEDTQSTEEAPITEEIASLAESLKWNPVQIYEYVKNNIETEWYWGCMKGAEETLYQKSGNDCDQAILFASLLRASGFPTRYIRGTIEFFPDMSSIKNNLGIDDPLKIAEFLQKAGIPYKPVIQGGKIANFQIERIWIESQIPYGNYRGAIIDDSDKTWLGLDTSIKVKDYVYNNPIDIFQQSGISSQLTAIRDEYLGAVQTQTPLEYLETKLTTGGYQLSDLRLTKALVPETLKILPASMQFKQTTITHEYTEIPDELKHKVRFVASDPQSATPDPLFDITLNTMELSNRQIALSYEPETVEDQQIIDSYGGLDNTPAYLVRLRPVLKVDGEMVVAGRDGLPMGEDHELTIELISPNGTEKTTNTHITGNLTAIAITAQKAISDQQSAISEDDDAETILFKEANRYIGRWNQAEEELASLMHMAIVRPIPTVVTIGGVIDVTYLLDMPHGFEWKGVFVDAGLRAVSVQPSAVSTDDGQKTFMQLSALQGSILENRIFEDDFQVESISTAKLIQLCKQQSADSCQVITIDRTNIAAVLPTLTLDDNIREDIINTVNQGFIVRILQPLTPDPQSLITYEDWSGIGYIKENPETGEAGYMLSGMLVPFTELAGGMTAINKENWKNQDFANKVGKITGKTTNQKPEEAVRIVRLNKNRSDYQDGIVGTGLKTSLEVIALDGEGNPVQNLKLSFTISAGAGKLQGVNKAGNPVKDVNTGSSAPASQVTLTTGPDGVARARLTLGQQTEVSPYYVQKTNASGDKYWELVGLNLVSVSASTTRARMTTDKPFEAYGKPGAATELIKLNPTTDIYGPPSILASPVWVKIIDQYGNPISDKSVKFSIRRDYLGTPPATGAISAKLFGELSECPGVATIDCPYAKEADVIPFEKRTEYFGIYPYLIMGNTEDTKFTVTATANKDSFDSKGKRIDNNTALNSVVFTFYTKLVENGYVAVDSPYFVDGKGNKIDAGKAGETFPQPISAVMYYTERTREGTFKVMPVVKELPPGSPLKNDAKVEFQVYAGGGSANPVLQTQETDGYYSTTLKLGDTPGKNRINAIGSVTASVPAYDSQGNVTRTDKMLVAYYPIEIWGVKLTVPSYQQVVLNSEGYPVADVEFKYDIDPLDYQFTPANLGVEIYEKSATGSESLMGFVPADSNLKIILSKGMAKFSPDNTYYAQVVLNRGTKTEVRSEKVPLLNAVLIPDYDRNGNIDDADRERAARGDTFYFWINDDDDEGETGGTDVPGEIHFSDGLLDYGSKSVDGVRDLIDFFPVHLDIKDLLRVYDPAQYKYVLKSEFNNVNIVLTDMTDKKTRAYLTGNDDSLEPALTLSGKITNQVLFSGLVLNSLEGGQTFLQKIRDEEGKGIIICEGRLAGKAPLVLEVIDSENKSVLSLSMNLSLSGVEEMFRHENLTSAAKSDAEYGPDSKYGVASRDKALNCPDVECLGADPQNIKNFVFLHGYNVNGQQARGWHSEMFKRMFWSGSKARFWGVTWYGWDSQELFGVIPLPATPNYHINVIHAFDTVPALRNFLRVTLQGDVTVAAHSLGNMVVSAMLTDYAGGWDSSRQIKDYFMIDAAVASEAFGSRDDNNYIEMNKDTVTNLNMAHPDWNAYENRLWSSEWHLLFKGQTPSDNREKLTWRNIFAVRPSSVKYYNFYSSGEDVLDKHEGYPEVPDIVTNGIGRYAWALQEKLKGRTLTDGILGSSYGGWGFNLNDDEYRIELSGKSYPIYPAEANSIDSVQLRTRPFFSKGSDELLFIETGGSQYANDNRIRLLADAIPARTLAAGKQIVTGLITSQQNKGENHNMQDEFKTKKMTNIYWPRSKEEWLHGDLREIAYSYINLLFDDFVKRGGL